MIIETVTDRLLLRQWRDADIEPFAAMNADPRVMEFFPALLERAATEAMVERQRTLIAERGWGLWAVEIAQTREFIGYVGLLVPTPGFPCGPCVEIGWRLAFAHWGKGYAKEAARAVLSVGFVPLELDEIVSFTTLQNHRSRRVMEGIGMLDTGLTFDHPRIPIGSPIRHHCLYRLTREQWRAAAAVRENGPG